MRASMCHELILGGLLISWWTLKTGCRGYRDINYRIWLSFCSQKTGMNWSKQLLEGLSPCDILGGTGTTILFQCRQTNIGDSLDSIPPWRCVCDSVITAMHLHTMAMCVAMELTGPIHCTSETL